MRWEEAKAAFVQSCGDMTFSLEQAEAFANLMQATEEEIAYWKGQTNKKMKKAAELQEEIARLREALSELVHLHGCEMEGIESGMPKYEDWMAAILKAETALNV